MFKGLKLMKQAMPAMKELREQSKEILNNPDTSQQVAKGMETLAAQEKAANIATSGIDASATITAVRQTPSAVNYQPVFELDLTVLPEGGPPYPATAYQLVPQIQLAQLQPGRSVHVKVDPNDPSVVWVDLAGEPQVGAGGQADPIAQLEKLAELRKSGALTDAEFEQQKKRILGEQ
jgi:hypothetical protein